MCRWTDVGQSPMGTGISNLRQQHPLTATCAVKTSHVAEAENEGWGV